MVGIEQWILGKHKENVVSKNTKDDDNVKIVWKQMREFIELWNLVL